MRRGALVVGLVVVAGVGWWLGSPLFIRTTVQEALPTAAPLVSAAATTASAIRGGLGSPAATSTGALATPVATATGPVVLAQGQLQYVDGTHNGKGAVRLLRVGEARFLRFEDVAITNAPDVHVYLSRETGGKWSDATSLYLGALKATNGSFNYEIPAGADLAPFRSVVVWCRAFSVLVTWADLS